MPILDVMKLAQDGSWSTAAAVMRVFTFAAFFAVAAIPVSAPPANAEPPAPPSPSRAPAAAPAPAGGDGVKDGAISPPIAEWRVPEGCPEARTVAERARQLAGLEAEAWARTGTVRGQVVSETQGWVLSLEIGRGSPARGLRPALRQRVFHAADCEALAEAAAVAMALALGGSDGASAAPEVAPAPPVSPVSAEAAPPAPPPAPPGPTQPLPGAAPAGPELGLPSGSPLGSALAPALAPDAASRPAAELASSAPSSAPSPRPASAGAEALVMDSAVAEDAPDSSRRALRLVARAGALVDSASLGGAALGGGAEVGLQLGSLGLGLYGVGLPSREIGLSASESVALSLWAMGLRGCYRAADDGWATLDVCAGAEAGALGAQGRNLIDASTRRDVWGAATSGTSLAIDIATHWQAAARLEAVVPLSRTHYLVNGDERVYEIPAASVRAALSFGGTLGWR